MMLYDPELTEVIRESIPVEIEGRSYIIEPNRSGSCDGCSFYKWNDNGRLEKCPTQAVKFCCSNGGNILKEVTNEYRI